jgi:hypothetical protein
MSDLNDLLPELLQAVGDYLAAEGLDASIVVVGGASLNLLGIVERSTHDVDVIARASGVGGAGPVRLHPGKPLPEELSRVVRKVARDYALPDDWLNSEVASQWSQGLPPTLPGDIEWRRFGTLDVGLAGRRTLIALKLFAAADRGPRSVHLQDLLALAPTPGELDEAAEWVLTQDASPLFPRIVAEVVEHVRSASERGG